MELEHFILNKYLIQNPGISIPEPDELDIFTKTNENIAAWGLFAIGVCAQLTSGYYVIENFNMTSQIVGWSGVAVGTYVGLKGAFLIGDLDQHKEVY